MIHIGQELIQFLSFDDEPVTNAEINHKEKILRVYTKGATILCKSNKLFKDRTDMWLGKGVLIFRGWDSLTVYRKKKENEEPQPLDISEYERLQDILIFEEGDDYVKIAGQGIKSGFWDEWMIIGSKYCAEFEEYDTTCERQILASLDD